MRICDFVKQNLPSYTKHPLYCTWRMMNYRCYCDVHTNFETYGGAGIIVSQDWRWDNPDGLENFIKDMGERPQGCTLDRENPYGNYEKENCRWATKKEQQNNFRKERDSKSGIAGVLPVRGGRWLASIYLESVSEKSIRINIFDTIEEASAAREKALIWKMTLGEEEAFRLIKEQSTVQINGKRAYNKKTSKYYGVSWSSQRQKWRTQVWYRDENGKLKSKYLGAYDNEEDAGKAVSDYLKNTKEN